MNTTTLLEASLFLVAATTLGFSVWSLWHSHLDHKLLARLRMNGVKRLTLRARLMRDLSRVACAALLCGAAMITLHEPPDTDDVALVLKVTILLVSLLLGLAVYGDWRWRMEIDEALEELEAQRGR